MEGESSTCTHDELENIILNGSSGPCSLPLEHLRRVTNDFSDERLLGEGGFGKVYKGVLRNGKVIAVKRLDQLLKPGVQERQFENEVYHLMKLNHPNIVRLLGYCYETWNECVEHDGKYIFAERQQKLICLEYLPNGSLDRHLSDESSGHEWHTRYKIIKGICCGLLYLHEECQCQFGASIIHLDLKPGNILLDEYMGAKITDFGLSRLFEDNKTQTCATFLLGSRGYMAPEYLIGQIVTAKADIYNLGVIIIEIITGSKASIFSFSSPSSCQKFVDGVINNWRNRLEGAPSVTDCKQIKHCLEIGLDCIKFNREERPTSREIIERLDGWEITNCNISNEQRPNSTCAGRTSIQRKIIYMVPGATVGAADSTEAERPLDKTFGFVKNFGAKYIIFEFMMWFDQILHWRNPLTTIVVHVLFVILVLYSELILPVIFVYQFVIGLWLYMWRPRQPPHMDNRLSHAETAHSDELDTFPTLMRSVAGRIQTVVGDLVMQGEWLLSLLSWRDPRASAWFMVFCFIASIVMFVTPSRVVVLLAGLYMLRHPRFRNKMPSVPIKPPLLQASAGED